MFDINVERVNNSNSIRDNINTYKNSINEFNPNAFYIGIVVNTNDVYKLGRVQIRIPCIHGVNPRSILLCS